MRGPRSFEVLAPGLLTTVQDAGRAGHAHLGVPPSGAVDRPSFELANRLVGNPAGAAAFETTVRGPRLRLRTSDGGVVVAVTGAPLAVNVDSQPVAFAAAVYVPDGAVIELGAARSGVRSYLAIAGGIDVDPVLGSRSTDLLSGLGPAPLVAGNEVPLGRPYASAPSVDYAAPRGISREPVLRIIPGPRTEWFTPAALDVLTSTRWCAAPASNRVALRLAGPPLARSRTGELPPEGVVTGSIEVPADGQPLIFLNDHPTTGGYPVIAVLTDDAIEQAAQVAPGVQVRFQLDRDRRAI